MRKLYGIGLILTSWLLLIPAVANGQAIGGAVTDATGAVLPGVTVEARSPALIEQVRSAVSDGAGLYLITALSPGKYTVTFSLQGFSTVIREDIELSSGFTATIDVKLPVGSVSETLTVTGSSPLVDVQNVRQQSVMDRTVIDAVPTGKQFYNLGVLVPGMVTGGALGLGQDVGGQGGQTRLDLAIHGSRSADQMVTVDGLTQESFSRTSSVSNYQSDAAYGEMVFDYAGNSAEIETGGVRVNLIPREGGNTFHTGVFGNFSTPKLQSKNVDDALRARNLRDPNGVKTLWNYSATLGGPIAENRLWFFGQYGRQRADSYLAGVYYSKDPTAMVYQADTTRQAFWDDGGGSFTTRLTAQVTPRNKVTAFVDDARSLQGHFLCGQRAGGIATPDGCMSADYHTDVYQVGLNSPVSSRFLIEANFGVNRKHVINAATADSDPTRPGLQNTTLGINYRNIGGMLYSMTRYSVPDPKQVGRASFSYVTGSHAVKVGLTGTWGFEIEDLSSTANNLSYTTGLAQLPGAQFGLSNPVNQYIARFTAYPVNMRYDMKNIGIFAQDQWTRKRFTINAGVRLDVFRNTIPDIILPAVQWVPIERKYDGRTAVAWQDVHPRFGLTYDVRGDGRTAIKASANRYGTRAGIEYARALFPLAPNTGAAILARAWADLNGDDVPQGDPRNPLPNGELIAASPNPNWGTPTQFIFYDPEWATGWQKRFANWEFSTSVQHEVRPGLSVNVGYFRRIYVNPELGPLGSNNAGFDNRQLTGADFDTYSVTAPSDPRLPGGGGYTVANMVDPKPTAATRLAADRFSTSADNFGSQSEHWNGMDFSANARMNNLRVQGGFSFGSRSVETCNLDPDQRINVSNFTGAAALGSYPYCAFSTPWLAQVKGLGSYTLPFDLQASATYQSLPGPERTAVVAYPRATITTLGRPLLGSQVSVNVLKPGTSYGQRMHQVDLRLAKNFRLSGGRQEVKGMVDLYNAFNGNMVLQENQTYGSITGATSANWLAPTQILPARLIKFGFQYSF